MTTMGKEASLDGLEFDGETVLCRVCGDKASGFHYGVHACEGCKGFFRRSIQQKIQYRPCLKNQQCNIMRVNRNRCQYCRLKKCIAVGMSRDAVRFGRVPKKEKARIIEQMQKVNSQSHNASLSNVLQNPHELIQHVIAAHRQTCMFPLERIRCLREAALQKGEFINCPAHMACPLNANLASDPNDNSWEDFSEFFTPSIKSVVDFAKAIPGFCVLNQDDQVTLLKAATFEVLLVRLASLFDPDTNTMLFTIGKLFKRQPSTVATSAGFLLDSMFDFAERFNRLNLNDDEIALFSAVVLLSPDRPGLRNIEQIEKVQNKLTESLQNVINTNHRDDNTLFAKLLMKTTDLRTLNTLHSEKSIGQGKDGSDTEMMDYRANMHDSVVESRSEGSSPSDTSSVATSNASLTGYDLSSTSMEGSGAPVLPHRMPVDTQCHQQVVLKTPYGTFYREESFYGLVPDQPRRRCHTLDRETVTRPRLHTIEEGSRRRNTLDRDYINKMVNKLSDRLEKRAAIRGDSMPPSVCNSAASSPIPEEFQQYMNRNHEFIPISAPADSSACSSRASPLINRDTLLPYTSSPSSPNPRSRSGSMGADDYGSMRRRCYSFHMNSDGRAARGASNLCVQGGDHERISPDEYQNSLMPEIRRGSVGAAYGLHVKKKSLIVDRHPAYLSRLSDTIKKRAEERHLLEPIGSGPIQQVGEGSSAFDNVSSIRIPVPCRPSPKSNWHQPPPSSASQAMTPAVIVGEDPIVSKEAVVPSQDTTSSSACDLKEPMSPMAVDAADDDDLEKTNLTLESAEVTPAVFHKKFDKIRKHNIIEKEAAKNEVIGDKSETSPQIMDRPQFQTHSSSDNDKTVYSMQDSQQTQKTEKHKLSAVEAHPQLLAHLKSPSRAVVIPTANHTVNAPSLSQQQQNNLCLSVNMQNRLMMNGLTITPSSSVSNCVEGQVAVPGSGQLHATTMSHLKDKLMRKFDSMENLNKIGTGQPTSSQYPANIENSEIIAKQKHPTCTAVNSCESRNADKNEFHPGMMSHGQISAGNVFNHGMYPNSAVPSMHPAFLGVAAYNSMQSVNMVPGYNQHLAGMQQLAQLYGGHQQMRVNQEGQPLNLTRVPSAAAGSVMPGSLLSGDNSRQPSALEQGLSEHMIKEEVSS